MYPNLTHTLSFANEASNEGDLETLAQEEIEEAIQTPWRLILYNENQTYVAQTEGQSTQANESTR